jgi:hypothetical protein
MTIQTKIAFCGLALALVISQFWKYRKAQQAHEERMKEHLLKRLMEARMRRTQWEEEHPLFLFGYPEYEELWEAEIGAQDIFIVFGGMNVPSSLIEYCTRREKFEKEHNE